MKKGQEPAFPQTPFIDLNNEVEFGGYYRDGVVGISTRLYIATRAMQGILANPKRVLDIFNFSEMEEYPFPKAISKLSFGIADALLEEAEK